jgi:hypothetical protein
MTMTNKRFAAIGVTAGVLAGAGIGAILGVPGLSGATSPAQQDTTTTTDDTTTDGTTDDSTTDDTDRAADHQARLRENLQGLVDEGTLTTEQADRVAEFMIENRPDRGEGGPHFGGRHGRGGPGGIGADGEVAEFLGLTPEELREQLQAGATLESLLPAGSTVDELVAVIIDDLEEHLADGVEDGRLTQAEADEKLAEATERITERITTAVDGPPEAPADGPIGD